MSSSYMGWGHRMPDYQLMAPFPYFGGKRNAAPAVWAALGDVGGYIEPFAGSAAVLLGRPPVEGPRVETINDADGWLINAWRAIKHDPEGVAREAFMPVSEIDYHARAAWLAERRDDNLISWLEGDPEAYDSRAAAYWLYVSACAIGFGPLVGGGPWHVSAGHLIRTETSSRGITRAIPHIGGTGRGILRNQPESAGETGADRAVTYLQALQRRLEAVRITAGDWARVLAPSVLNLSVGSGQVGVFLDPPYAGSSEAYAVDTGSGISADVLDWCLTADPKLRIVLAGYGDDNDALLDHGWRKQASIGGQGSGFSNNPENGRRERLWFSPACINPEEMLPLWEEGAAS